MRYLKSCFSVCLVLLLGSSLFPWKQEKKADYPLYWQQKATLYELLPNDEEEIIFLGNSITEGCNWSELFQDRRVKNRGISGDVTEGVLDRLDEVVESRPLKVFLMIGINDLARGKTGKEVVGNIKKIVKSIQKKSPDTEIYLESLLPVNKDFGLFGNYTNKTKEILAVNRVLKRMAEEFGITYVDLHSLFTVKDNQLNPEYTNDGLHLTGKGYLRWKTAIQEYLSPSDKE